MKHNIPIRRLLAGVALVLGLCPGLCLAAAGDMNCDGLVNASDVSPLVLSLVDPAEYTAVYPGCNVLNADVDGNGLTDGRDITAFVNLLLTPPPQEIVLRDSIGPNNTMVEGNAPIGTSYRNGNDWNIVPQHYTATQAIILSQLSVVVGNIIGNPFDFTQHDYRLMVWLNQADFNNSPGAGTYAEINLDVPSHSPEQVGIDLFGGSIYKLVFDIGNFNVSFASSQSFIFAFQDIVQNGTSGYMALIESDENGSSDIYCGDENPPPNCLSLYDHPWRQHYGRVGITLKTV